MKYKPLFFSIVFIIAACSTAVPATTNTPLPTYASSSVATETPTPPAETVVPTETPAPERDSTMDRPLEIISSFPIENVKTKEGAVVNGAFSVDRSAERNGLHEVSMPDSLGAELLLKVGATLDKYHGEMPTTGELTDNDITDYARRLAAAQNGQGPIPTANIFAFDANKPGVKMLSMNVALFPGNGEVPQGVQRIDNVEIVYGSWYEPNEELQKYVHAKDMPRFTVVEAGAGYESEIDKNILRIKVSTDFLTDETNINIKISKYTSILFKWIEQNNGNTTQKIVVSARKYYNQALDLQNRGIKTK